MGKLEDEIIGSSVKGMMSMKLKERRKYFKFANLESIFMNDMKKLLYSITSLPMVRAEMPLSSFL